MGALNDPQVIPPVTLVVLHVPRIAVSRLACCVGALPVLQFTTLQSGTMPVETSTPPSFARRPVVGPGKSMLFRLAGSYVVRPMRTGEGEFVCDEMKSVSTLRAMRNFGG